MSSLASEDDFSLQAVIDDCERDEAAVLEVLRAGMEAIPSTCAQIQFALEIGSFSSLQAAIHHLTRTSALPRLMEMSRICHAIEESVPNGEYRRAQRAAEELLVKLRRLHGFLRQHQTNQSAEATKAPPSKALDNTQLKAV